MKQRKTFTATLRRKRSSDIPVSSHGTQRKPLRLKLFYVSGVRHSAVVLASSSQEAVKLAVGVSRAAKSDPYVLYGSVGDWEVPEAHELKLPSGCQLVTRSVNAYKRAPEFKA